MPSWEADSTDRKNYLRIGRQLSQDALVAATAEEKVSTIDHLRIVRAGLHKLFQHAVEVNDHGGAAAVASALQRNIELSVRRDDDKNKKRNKCAGGAGGKRRAPPKNQKKKKLLPHKKFSGFLPSS